MNIKPQFPLFTEHPDIVYLDNAATVQKPQYVVDEVNYFLTHEYANIHRWMYALSLAAEEQRDRARTMVANVLGARADEIIFTWSATYASNTLARSCYITWYITEWDILVLGMSEHHATITPWQDVAQRTGAKIVYIPQNQETALYDWSILDAIDITRVKIVCCSLVSNVLWCKHDLSCVKKLSKKYQFYFVIDIAQAIPHFLVDIEELWADFIYFTGHKVGALPWIGVLRWKKEHLAYLQPMYSGGGAIDMVRNVSHTYQHAPDKFEPWTPNLVGAVSLRAAFEWIASLWWLQHASFRDCLSAGYATLDAHEKSLVAISNEQFWELERNWLVQVMWGLNNPDRIGLFSWTSPFVSAHEIGRKLAAQNICIRTWMHCTHPLHHAWQVEATARMSLWAYNDFHDLHTFFEVLKKTIMEKKETTSNW